MLATGDPKSGSVKYTSQVSLYETFLSFSYPSVTCHEMESEPTLLKRANAFEP